MEILNIIAGFLVGCLVGLTGVGGGSLMAPILILIFGVAPLSAVGTDLWFAAITKTIGAGVHHRTGGPDYTVVKRLLCGSLPGAALTIWFLHAVDMPQIKSDLIMFVLGVVLIATALVTLFRMQVNEFISTRGQQSVERLRTVQTPLTIFAGFALGIIVSLTSVGAGALGATMLLMLYPKRLPTRRLIATDIVHAVPLTALAGLGHMWAGNVNFYLLGLLLVGSIPGIIIGSLLASRVKESLIRPALACVLAFAGLQLLL